MVTLSAPLRITSGSPPAPIQPAIGWDVGRWNVAAMSHETRILELSPLSPHHPRIALCDRTSLTRPGVRVLVDPAIAPSGQSPLGASSLAASSARLKARTLSYNRTTVVGAGGFLKQKMRPLARVHQTAPLGLEKRKPGKSTQAPPVFDCVFPLSFRAVSSGNK
jgi:hypothetical protein